jgi:hypothetical protein
MAATTIDFGVAHVVVVRDGAVRRHSFSDNVRGHATTSSKSLSLILA